MIQKLRFSVVSLMNLATVFALPHTAINTSARIVIVGSGMAGLGAADQLINTYGFKNVYILEALDRLGGRIDSVPYENGTLPKGSEWLRDETSPLFRVARQIKALASSDVQWSEMSKQWEVYTQSGCKLQPNQVKQMEKIRSNTDLNVRRKVSTMNTIGISVGRLYNEAFETLLKNNTDGFLIPLVHAVFQIKKRSIEAENSVADWNKLSSKSLNTSYQRAYIGLGPSGFQPILDYFIGRIPKSNVLLKTRIRRMYYNRPDSKIQIYTSDGGGLLADHVVMTSSLGVLQKCAQAIFNPPLPREKYDSMTSLGYDSVDKIFLLYDKPFWGKKPITMNFVRLQNEKQLCINSEAGPSESFLEQAFWLFHTKPYHSNVLVTWILGNDVRNIASLSDGQLGQVVTRVLKRYLNDSSIPEPQRIVRSNWQGDPTFRGSFSYDSVECDLKNCKRSSVAEPVYTLRDNRACPTILFAGEATHETLFSTTEGALLSGIREADRIKKFIDSTN